MKKKSLLLIIAFICFIMGFLSLLMSILGLQFTYLRWLEKLPLFLSISIKSVLMIGGILTAYMATLNEEEKEL
ncbi:MAG: hypothetical protein ABI844_17435 [Saprospiraceae bacterium]